MSEQNPDNGDLPDRQSDNGQGSQDSQESTKSNGGDMGGPRVPKAAGLNFITQVIKDGGATAEAMAEYTVWARKVLNDSRATKREKAAAGRLIANLSRTVLQAAIAKDKMDRLDEDRPTENLNVDGVQVIVTIPGEERFRDRSTPKSEISGNGRNGQ